MDSRKRSLIWRRALAKIGQIKKGSFEGSRPLSDSYWKEKLDPLHRPNTELQTLWNEFRKDNSFTSLDFYTWLAVKNKVPKQQVTYLEEAQRATYNITFNGADIVFSNEAQQAGMNEYDGELIFALDGANNFYFGVKAVGTFHHSSMLAGAPVAGAGTILVSHRHINEVNNHSGHYKPGMAEMRKVATAMKVRGAAVHAIVIKVYTNNKIEWQGKAMLLT